MDAKLSSDPNAIVTNVEEKRPRIDSLVQLALKELDIPGISVGFVVDGKTVFAEGYGFRDHSDPRSQVTARTLFAIGSCTKAFTTYVLSRLVDERDICWDSKVTTYVPDFQLLYPQETHQITVKDLVTHATGLPRHDLIWKKSDRADSLVPNMTIDETLRRLSYLATASDVRREFMYNNIMYGVAGRVIERTSERGWRESVRDLIFRPLGMTRSYCSLKDAQQQLYDGDIARPHRYDVREACLTTYPDWMVIPEGVEAAASIVSTAEDMAKWIQLQLSEKIPRDMHTPHMPINEGLLPEIEGVFGYGLGWFIGHRNGRHMVCHGGQVNGFRSSVVLFPGEKQGIVVLANIDYDYITNSPIEKLAFRIVDILTDRASSDESDEEWVSSLAKFVHGVRASFRLDDSAVEAGKQIDRPEQYVGQFENPSYGIIEISFSDSRLTATYNDMQYVLYGKKGPDFFSARSLTPVTAVFVELCQFECSFERDSSGDVRVCRLELDSSVSFDKKISEELQAEQYLKSFAGVYENVLLSIRVTLIETRGSLSLIARDASTNRLLEELKPYKRNWFRLGVYSYSTPFEFVVENETVSKLIIHLGETLSVLRKKNDECENI